MATSITLRSVKGSALTHTEVDDNFSNLKTTADAAVTSGAITSSGLTMATGKLLGRSSASTGAVQEIIVGAGLALSGGQLEANLGAYLTTADAATTYQPISSMTAYLLSSTASSTYALVSHSHTISDVTGLQTALDGKQPIDADLTAIAGLAGTSGLLKKTAADTWSLDTSTYLTSSSLKTVNGESLVGSGNLTITSGVGVTLTGDTNIYVSQAKTYTITNYNAFSTYTVSVTAGSASISGDTISFTAPSTAQTVTLTVNMDSKPTTFSLVIQAAGVNTPSNSAPSNGATNQDGTVTLTASAFSWLGLSDTHASSDWQIATDAGFTNIVQSQTDSTTNKTSWTVSGLSVSQTYYWRVRYKGTTNGTSAWSTATNFTTKASFGGLIGTQGGQGFGVGEYPDTLPSGFSAMTGSADKTSANYGNYQYSDGSIMVFVPRFYYRIGSASSPRYATYGANAIDIVGIETYATEAAANAAGYAMHRAFKDGGADKKGFFIDKYLASKNGTTSCKSVQNGNPISLTTNASYNPSSGMTGCTGILADAVVLARSRGAGTFNVASIFMYSALSLLSLAHAQASSNTTYCAWYDATNNFPKGCNNGALADTNDTGVTFTTAGVSGDFKPLTGSGSPFAKTTHNGQSCGIADVNGAIWQVMLGLTNPGTSATDTVAQANGNAYILKTSVALASLTGGWNGTNDAWGDSTNLATKYDNVTGLMPWGSTTGSVYFGNGTTGVFSGATSGISWQRTACGIQDTTSGTSAAGTSQFGNDQCYQYNVANLFPLAAGYWNYAADAGVFHRYWGIYRSNDNSSIGFRASAYGS